MSFLFLNDIYFCISRQQSAPALPLQSFLKTRTHVSSKGEARGTCEPSISAQTLHSYSGTAGATQQKSIKHSGESPSVTFIIITKKSSDDVSA